MTTNESTLSSNTPDNSLDRLEVKLTFDPIAEAARMHSEVTSQLAAEGKTPIGNFDDRVRLENKFIDGLADSLVYPGAAESWSEIHTRIRAADRTEWAMREIQRVNSEIHDGYEVTEVIDKKRLSDMVAVQSYYRDNLGYEYNSGRLDQKYIPTDMVDAVSVSTGLGAVLLKEGLSVGPNMVDLGGGDGVWSFAFSECGYNVTMIERDERLVEQYLTKRRRLEKYGSTPKDIKVITSEFNNDKSKNIPEVNQALDNADVFMCYPWPDEINSRLELFKQHAKPGAVMVMYGGAMDDFILDNREIERLGLEVVGKEINEQLKIQKEHRYIKGYNTPSFGANWAIIRVKD